MPRAHPYLMSQTIGTELIVFDPVNNLGHCLDSHAALVYQHCDGQTTQIEVAAKLSSDPAQGEELLAEALELLSNQNLFPASAENTRRDFLRNTVVALPLITSVLIPAPAAAASCLNFNQCVRSNCSTCHNSNPGRGGTCEQCVCLNLYCRSGGVDTFLASVCVPRHVIDSFLPYIRTNCATARNNISSVVNYYDSNEICGEHHLTCPGNGRLFGCCG